MAFDIHGYIRALESRDTERMLSFFAEDVEIWAEDATQPFRGKELLRRFAEMGLRSLEEVKVEPLRLLQDDRHTALLAQVSASYSDDVELPDGTRLDVAGKRLQLTAAIFIDNDEQGRIAHVRRVRDNWSVMKQLGITPEEYDRLMMQMQQPGGLAELHS